VARRKKAEAACAKTPDAWGIKYSVPGSREVWSAPGGGGSLVSDFAQRFATREAAEKSIAWNRNSSVKMRVVPICDPPKRHP